MIILVVEDDDPSYLVIEQVMQSAGHDIARAKSGEEAVEYCTHNRVDMVLMDIVLPNMSGYEATRQIKSIVSDKFLPIIFITSITDEVGLKKCIDAGGDDFISKPVSSAILVAKIQAMERILDLYVELKEQKDILTSYKYQIDREHEFAENIIENISQNAVIALPGVNSIHIPAQMFSGDIILTASSPSGGLNVLVGDVAGRGLASSIYALPVSDIFYAMSAKGFQIEPIIIEINKRLSQLLPTGMFLAACICHIDEQCRQLSFWNGGLPDVLLKKSNGEVESLASRHLPLGVQSQDAFDSSVSMCDVDHGSRLMITTDGVDMVVKKAKGGVSLKNILEKSTSGSDLKSSLIECIDHIHQVDVLHDDVTLVDIMIEPELMHVSDESESVADSLHAKSWKVDFDFNYDTLQHVDPLPHVIQCLTGIQGMDAHRAQLFTILSELFNNALDHGVLGLDSSLKQSPEGFLHYYTEKQERLAQLSEGFVRIHISNEPKSYGALLTIRVEDSGDGFNQASLQLDMEANREKSGRGIPLLKSLCEEVSYNQQGNCVVATYSW